MPCLLEELVVYLYLSKVGCYVSPVNEREQSSKKEKEKKRGKGRKKKSQPILSPARGSPTRTLKPLRCAPGWSAARPTRRVALWRCCLLGLGHLGRRGGPGGGVAWRHQGQLCWRRSRAGGGPRSQSPPASPRRSHCSGWHLLWPGLRRNNRGHGWALARMAQTRAAQWVLFTEPGPSCFSAHQQS